MTTYTLVLETFAGEPAWQYDIEQPSDALAIEQAERIACTSSAFRHAALALSVFNMDTRERVAQFVLDKPVVRRTDGGRPMNTRDVNILIACKPDLDVPRRACPSLVIEGQPNGDVQFRVNGTELVTLDNTDFRRFLCVLRLQVQA